MNLSEIKELDNNWWLDFLRKESIFDVDRIEDMISSLIKMADTSDQNKLIVSAIHAVYDNGGYVYKVGSILHCGIEIDGEEKRFVLTDWYKNGCWGLQ